MQDTHTEREVDATTRVPMVRHQHPVSGKSGARDRLPAEAARRQVVVGAIPLEPPGFRRRAGLLAKLSRAGGPVTVIHAVGGLRGQGSTQLAATYARAKLAAGWPLVAWVNAADTGSLQAGLAAVADALGLADGDCGRDIADPGQAVRNLLETDGNRRLLVFDDAADLETLRPFLPATGTARVLVTSGWEPTADLATGVPVGVFSAIQARSFLTGRTGLDEEAGAAAVAGLLGHLPLALALAAPVISGQDRGYAWYLGRLQTTPADVSRTGTAGQLYSHGVAQTALLSLAAVRAADKAGVCTRALEIIAVLSAAGVPCKLLHVAGQAGVLVGDGHRIAAPMVDRVLEWLRDRSLLSFSLDGQTVIMHRLVAQVVRDGLARRQRLAAVCWVAASVLEAQAIAVARTQDRLAVRSIPQHVTALRDHSAGLSGEADEELATILLRLRFIALYHLIELGDSVRQAVAVGEPLMADLERLLGPDHPDTLNARNSLAAAYLAAGRTDEAIPLFERILAKRERVLGPGHPDAQTSRNNLAAAYQDAGQAAAAIKLYELNLAIRERLLGPGHLRTLTSRGNLAAAYRDAGRPAEAIPLFERILAERERVLGPGHPDAQTARNNLAAAYRDAGRPAAAISPAGQTLAGRDSQPPAAAAGQVLPVPFRRPASAVRRVSWASIRANPGVAIAALAVAVWIVAAVSVTLLRLAGFHLSRALGPALVRRSCGAPASAVQWASWYQTARVPACSGPRTRLRNSNSAASWSREAWSREAAAFPARPVQQASSSGPRGQ